MGISTNCTGRSLFNHLKQKNVDISDNYSFNKSSLKWEGTITVYGTTYKTTGKQTKNEVLETLMRDAESFIYCNLSSVKKK